MNRIFWIIILLNIAIRLICIDMPLLEGSATRQIYSAMVARTFYENGLNILYPDIPINGNAPFYQALEIQLTPFLAALGYTLAGNIYPIFLRFVSIFFTILALYVLYELLKILFNQERIALISIFIFGFSPISIYLGRSANFEMAIIFFNMATLLYFIKWSKTEKYRYALLANLCFFFAVSLKVPNLYLLGPILFIVISRWGFIQGFKKNWLMFLTCIAILFVQGWLQHLRTIAPHHNWLHFNMAYNIQSILHGFREIDFYKKVYSDSVNYVLTPMGLVFGFWGLLIQPYKIEVKKLFLIWFFGICSFYVVVLEGLWTHSYYHIHYLPIMAYFSAKAINYLYEQYHHNIRVIIVLFLFYTLCSARYSISMYKIPENKKHVLTAAHYIEKNISKDALIVSSVDSPSSLLYYANRKGWTEDFSYKGKKGIQNLEEYRKKGAQFFACAYVPELKKNEYFWKYLRKNYSILYETDTILIADLK